MMSKFNPQIEKGTVGKFINGYAILSQSIFHPRTKEWDGYIEPRINIINEKYERQLNKDYDSIEVIYSKSKHYFKVKSGNELGLLSSSLQMFLPTEYSDITVDRNSDIIRVAKFEPEHTLIQYIGNNKKLLRNIRDDGYVHSTMRCGNNYSQGVRYLDDAFPLFCNDFCIITLKGYKGILDLHGKYVIPPIYEKIEIINNDYLIVCKNSKYGIINFEESLLLDFTFELMKSIGDNYVILKEGKYEGVINVLLPDKLKLKEIQYFQTKKMDCVNGFIHYKSHIFHSEGIILVSIKDENENIKYGYEDYEGNAIIPIVYDDLSEFENGIAIATKNNKTFFIDKNNQLLQPLKFDSIQKTINGHYVVLRKNKYGLLRPDGSVLLDTKYTKIEFQKNPKYASCYGKQMFLIEINDYFYNYLDTDGTWDYEEWISYNDQQCNDEYSRGELDDMYRDAFDGSDDATWNTA